MVPTEVSNLLLPLVKEFEGCKLTAYQDIAGRWTIGYGHTGLDVTPGLVWTHGQADTQLAYDLADHYSQLVQISPAVAQRPAGQQAALTDFVYNLGVGTYERSTLRGAVEIGSLPSIVTQLSLWNHSNGQVVSGLTRRRNAEIALCQL